MPPLNGSGTPTQPAASSYPATANTLIEASKHNNSIADIYAILALALYKDGQQTATQRIPFAAGISADTIAELTAAAGVTIDGVLLKDALVGIGYGGTGQSTAQLAIDALSAVAAATNEHVLTKDTGTGNAVFKAAAGGLAAATQAEQETATSNTVGVTPGRQQFHPSAAKAWVNFEGVGTVAIGASYNVTSITDNAAGDYTVNFTTAFSSAVYAYAACGQRDGASTNVPMIAGPPASTNPTAAALRVVFAIAATTLEDVSNACIIAFVDQA